MIAGLIQARIGSQRCSNKMLRDFAGTNLVSLALKKFSVPSRSFNLYFAAHEDKLLQIGKRFNCNIIERDEASATGDKIEVVMNYLQQIPEDYVMFINACCPFLSLATLENAVHCFRENKAKSMTAVVKTHTWYYFQDGRAVNFLDPTNLNTKSTEPLYAVTHAFHIFNKQRFIDNNYFWAHGKNDPYFFETPDIEAIDIDTELEFRIAESLYLREHPRIIARQSKKVSRIKMFIMDVDGVLTDAGMYYSSNGDEMKKFNTRDGMGLKLLREAGIMQAIITGEDTQIVKDRAKKLKIQDVYMGVDNKHDVLKSLLVKHSISYDEVAFIGDDINDSDLFDKVGVSFSVADAPLHVRSKADYITRSNGGEGAVREACEIILTINEAIK